MIAQIKLIFPTENQQLSVKLPFITCYYVCISKKRVNMQTKVFLGLLCMMSGLYAETNINSSTSSTLTNTDLNITIANSGRVDIKETIL